mgnify:CR=1 FL=1
MRKNKRRSGNRRVVIYYVKIALKLNIFVSVFKISEYIFAFWHSKSSKKQNWFQTFDWKAGTLLILLFSFGVSGIVRSCSKEASREDRITQRDERNQYIALRCRAKTMEIMTYFLFAMVAGCMIGYGITKDTAFLWLLIGAGIPFGVLQIVSIVLGLYYERNQ